MRERLGSAWQLEEQRVQFFLKLSMELSEAMGNTAYTLNPELRWARPPSPIPYRPTTSRPGGRRVACLCCSGVEDVAAPVPDLASSPGLPKADWGLDLACHGQ